MSIRSKMGRGGAFPQFYESTPLAASITVTEGGPPTTLITLAITAPVFGMYRISLGLIAAFTSANDQLTWRVIGTFPSASDFLMESKDAIERLPFFHEVTEEITGDFTITIEAEVTGAGAADVVVDTANLFMQRFG